MPRLYHFSEDPDIREFIPHVAPTHPDPDVGPVIWAIEEASAHNYYFPRDCPRVTFYAIDETTSEDRRIFLGHTKARFVAAIESAWLERMRSTTIYRYRFDERLFEPFEAATRAGYHVSRETLQPLEVDPIPDLIGALTMAGVELRIMPSLGSLRDAVIASTLQFSIIRWRNAKP